MSPASGAEPAALGAQAERFQAVSRSESESLCPPPSLGRLSDPRHRSLPDPKELVGFPRALFAWGHRLLDPGRGAPPSRVPRLTPLGPGPPPPTRSETRVKGSPRHVVAEQHRLGRESRGRIGLEASDPPRLAAPGARSRPGARRAPAACAPRAAGSSPAHGHGGGGRRGPREGGRKGGGRPGSLVRAPHGRARARGRGAASNGLSRPAARLAHARDRRPRGHPRRFPPSPPPRRPGRGR